jgi:hypothetical protein
MAEFPVDIYFYIYLLRLKLNDSTLLDLIEIMKCASEHEQNRNKSDTLSGSQINMKC